jgi:hypothetical protein
LLPTGVAPHQKPAMKFSRILLLLIVIVAIAIERSIQTNKPNDKSVQHLDNDKAALRASVVKAINDASLEANTGIRAAELSSLLIITSPPARTKKDKANLALIIAEIESKWKIVSDSPIAVVDKTTGEYIYQSDK